jgi:hypothetical protein
MKILQSGQDTKWKSLVAEIADILAAGVLRLHLRHVRRSLKKNGKSETGLEVLPPKSLHRLEPKQRGERR